MSKVGSVIALSCGGVAVFTMAYAGVASIQGAALSDVPPFSWMAHDRPSTEDKSMPPPVPMPVDSHADERLVPTMTAGVLGAFVMPSPFDSRELQDLQTRLGERLASVEATEKALEKRGRELDEWQRTLEERTRELTGMRAELGTAEPMSAMESGPDAVTKPADDPESWRKMAPLFEEGDPDEMATKLASFEPGQAAQILKGLDPERSAALLNALPEASYKPVLDAWRRSMQ